MKEVKIGCSSSHQKYGKRLDTAIIQLPSNSNISGLFTSNKFPAAPVKVAKKNLTNLDKSLEGFLINKPRINGSDDIFLEGDLIKKIKKPKPVVKKKIRRIKSPLEASAAKE